MSIKQAEVRYERMSPQAFAADDHRLDRITVAKSVTVATIDGLSC
jgi:hypothetical protein